MVARTLGRKFIQLDGQIWMLSAFSQITQFRIQGNPPRGHSSHLIRIAVQMRSLAPPKVLALNNSFVNLDMSSGAEWCMKVPKGDVPTRRVCSVYFRLTGAQTRPEQTSRRPTDRQTDRLASWLAGCLCELCWPFVVAFIFKLFNY